MTGMDNSLRSLVEQSSSVLVLLPTRPYFDQVAAGLGLFLALKKEKNISIVCPSVMLVEFNRLVGVNKITTEAGNKNLVVKFRDYLATSIERVSYDIENGEFRLSIIPKPGVPAPDKKQVDLSYSGISAETVILVGGVNESHFPALQQKDLLGAKVAHVGIKDFFAGSGKEIMSLARPASCTSELVATLLKESSYAYDSDIATNLALGIEAGSNNFTGEGVNADTFQIFADLLRAGARRKSREVRPHYPAGAVPGEMTVIKPEEVETKEPPQDWIGPKIFKGTSVS